MKYLRTIGLLPVALAVSSAFSQNAPSKHGVDFTVFLGGSYYLGDLNPTTHFSSFTKPAGGIGMRFNHNTRLSTHATAAFGSLQADDSESQSPGQKARNLNFKTNIIELAAREEFNFVDYRMNDPQKFFSPYTFLGIAFFQFNPKGEIGGAWYSLRSLSTEGQGTAANPGAKKYKLFQVSIPFGVGFKLNLSERIDFSVEWGMRKTFTDYLDDVSTVYPDPVVLQDAKGSLAASLSDKSGNLNNTGRQRGNSQNKDWYSFGGIVLGFKFREPSMPCPAFE